MKKKPLGFVATLLVTVFGISGLAWLYCLWLPNAFWGALAGVLTYTLAVWVLSALRARRFGRHMMDDAHSAIINAIQEVARGNFNVMLEPDSAGPHSGMTEAFNKMARDLGDLDAMRQDFISNVSHEIQSPLTSIQGFAALLKDGGLPEGERLHYAEIIEGESRRLSVLSDSLLKLSALDNEKRPLAVRAFRLDKQIQGIALALEPQWSAKGLALEAELPPCEYAGDEDLLGHVWTNLLHNAVKFTPEGGEIRVSLAMGGGGGGGGSGGGGGVAVTVADSGAGIAECDLPRVFERFYTGDKSRACGGNGLGLSIVKKIVDMHGGSVRVRSEAGAGAAFLVELP